MLNPFAKKDAPEVKNRKEDMQFDHNENMMGNVMHPQATDEQIYLEQQEKRSDLIQWQQDLSDDIQKFIHKIRREVKVNDEWKLIEGMKPIANDNFIMDTVGLIELSTSKNLINSNYTEDRVLMVLRSTLYDFRCVLQENREIYEIKKSDMHLIVRLFKNSIEPTYWRCYNNGERKYAGDLNKRIEVHTDQPTAVKKGLFGMGG